MRYNVGLTVHGKHNHKNRCTANSAKILHGQTQQQIKQFARTTEQHAIALA